LYGDHVLNIEKKSNLETVLILQGGGSLGAYECGVYKTLSKHGIEFDVIAGTSIGAINASIIAAPKSDDISSALEEFWSDLSETITPPFLDDMIRAIISSTNAVMWGNPHAFRPLWFIPNWFLPSFNQPFMYDISPLGKTLKNYVDFDRLGSPGAPRLIVTSTDIQQGKPAIFDSKYDKIHETHILASAGYPFYGISWTKINGRYLWDGTLLSNTPLREVINASPKSDKKVYIVNLFPKKHEDLPKNMSESWHRARDLMHVDKTDHNIMMSRVISRYLRVMREMHDIINHTNLDEKMKERLKKLEPEFHKLACDRGAIIEDIIRIERSEESHFIFEDADFSSLTIKKLIKQGEEDAERVLLEKNDIKKTN
jgi:NTE family protein